MPAGHKDIVINGVDDLLLFIGEIRKGKASWNDLNADSISVIIPIQVDGEGWDGRIDYRGCKLIDGIQKQISTTYKKYSGENYPKDSLVKATSTQKCNLVNIDISKPLEEMVRNMPPEYLLISILSALVTFGGVSAYRHFVDRAKSRDQADTLQKALEEMKNVSVAAIKEGRDQTKPMRRYIGSLDKDDTIAIADGDVMTRAEAKSAVPSPSFDNDLYYTSCDGNFDLHTVGVKGRNLMLEISQNDIKTKAYFFERVPKIAKESILATVDAVMENQEPREMPLQVDCYFTDLTIEYCVIRNAGDPRPGLKHYRLSRIPDLVKAKDKHPAGIE